MTPTISRRATAAALLLSLLLTLTGAHALAEERPERLLTPEQARIDEAQFVMRTGMVMAIGGGSAVALGGLLFGIGLAVPNLSCNSRECSPSSLPTALLGAGATIGILGALVAIPGIILWPVGAARLKAAEREGGLTLGAAPAGSMGLGLAWRY
jgi:hypothetical protein